MVWILASGFWVDSPNVWDDSQPWIDEPPTPPAVLPLPQQVLRGGQWDPENWYVRSDESVRQKIRAAVIAAMGLSEEKADRVAARFANSAANPHLESLMPGREQEYLSHFFAANAGALHAAIEAQEQDDEEAIWLLEEDSRQRALTILSGKWKQ